MKVVAFGVTHWDGIEDFKDECPHCNKGVVMWEWYDRVNKFIGPDKLYLAAGTKSEQSINPLPIDLVQIGFERKMEHSAQNNYFRLGLMTGIWKALLDYPDFDILLHVQCSRFIGQDLRPLLEEFYKRDEQVMAFNTSTFSPREFYPVDREEQSFMDTGFLAMKKAAALVYVATGYRQSCDLYDVIPISCDEEALMLFKDSWWNPRPDIKTFKQFDTMYMENAKMDDIDTHKYPSTVEITDIEYYKKLPIVANGPNASHGFLTEWILNNPVYEENK